MAVVTALHRTLADIRALSRFTVSAATSGSSTVAGYFSSIVQSSLTNPFTREGYSLANAGWTNVVPSLDQLLPAYWSGRVSLADSRSISKWGGIAAFGGVGFGADANLLTNAWHQIVEQSRPTVDLGIGADLRNEGIIDERRFEEVMVHAGLRSRDRELFQERFQPLPMSLALQQYWLYPQGRGEGVRRVERSFWENELRRNGFAVLDRWRTLVSANAPFTPVDVIAGWYRGDFEEADVYRHMHAWGYTDDTLVERYLRSVRPMPGPADLVSFAVREVWDEEVVERFGYDEDFPEPFQHFMARQGYDWGEQFILSVGGLSPLVKWPVAYWRAHWQPMSPTQGYDALHRLRPDRIARYQEAAPGVTPFGTAELDTVLRIADYPPPVRKWLAAVSHVPLRLIDIRTAYQRGARNRQWAIDQLLDRGYVRADAEDIILLWDAQQEYSEQGWIRALERNASAGFAREIVAGYGEGLNDYATANAQLTDLDIPESTRVRMLALADAQESRRAARDYLAAVRRAFLAGEISGAEVRERLITYGLPAEGVARLSRRWNALYTTRRRVLSASQALTMLREGILTPAQVQVRLANLGWTGGDALLQIEAVRRRLSTQAVKLSEAQGRQRVGQAKAARAAQKEALSVAKAARAELRSLYPKAELKRWFVRGVASEAFVRARLAEQGWTPDYIERWVADAQKDKPAEETAPEGGPAGNGEVPGGAAEGG